MSNYFKCENKRFEFWCFMHREDDIMSLLALRMTHDEIVRYREALLGMESDFEIARYIDEEMPTVAEKVGNTVDNDLFSVYMIAAGAKQREQKVRTIVNYNSNEPFKNKDFEAFCNELGDLQGNIEYHATLEEKILIKGWWKWAHEISAGKPYGERITSEWNFARFVDTAMPELAARCAAD